MKKEEICNDNIRYRLSNYDLLRVVSSIAVVLIHVNADYYFKRLGEGTGFVYIAETFINFITRFSVPCFVMLSGAFVLNGRAVLDANKFYKKSLKKILVPYFLVLICWFIFYFYQMIILDKNYIGYMKEVVGLTPGNLWFVPMIAGCYLFAPLIKKVVDNLDDFRYAYISVIFLLWAVISQATTSELLNYSIGTIGAFLSYYMRLNHKFCGI